MADPSSHTRARRAALVSTLAVLLGGTALVAPLQAAAQAQPQSAVIGAVEVQGNERIDSETILSYLPLSVGDTIDPQRLDIALKALFKTDLFSDVKLDMNGATLVVRVVENPVINQVLFEGNSNLKNDKLEDEIQIRPRGVFTRARSRQMSAALLNSTGVRGASRRPSRPRSSSFLSAGLT